MLVIFIAIQLVYVLGLCYLFWIEKDDYSVRLLPAMNYCESSQLAKTFISLLAVERNVSIIWQEWNRLDGSLDTLVVGPTTTI